MRKAKFSDIIQLKKGKEQSILPINFTLYLPILREIFQILLLKQNLTII